MLTDFVNDRAVLKKRHISLRDDGPYSARNTSKGALIEEAARLFCAISSGLTIEQVREQTLRGTLLTQRSSQNRKRIWTLLQLRYLVPELPWITRLLAEKSGQGAQSAEFVSLLTCSTLCETGWHSTSLRRSCGRKVTGIDRTFHGTMSLTYSRKRRMNRRWTAGRRQLGSSLPVVC